MRAKALLALFLLVSASFAAWQNTAALAIVTSLILVAVVYMIGFGFGVDTLTAMAKDEVYQLIALAIMVAALFGANGFIDALSSNPDLAHGSATLQAAALASLDDSITKLSAAYADVRAADKNVGIAGSQGLSCNLQHIGYFVSGCGGFTMLAGPFSLAGSIMGFALGELNAIHRLIELAVAYALPLLLPLGIVLRTFRFTRGAGGLLMALAISIHILLPAGIVFVDMLGDSFLASTGMDAYQPKDANLRGMSVECRPGDISDENSDRAIGVYNSLRSAIKSYMYLIFVKATLGPVVAVLMMSAGIRAMTALAGAEVDVSALARVV
jgi:hypothetical protein